VLRCPYNKLMNYTVLSCLVYNEDTPKYIYAKLEVSNRKTYNVPVFKALRVRL